MAYVKVNKQPNAIPIFDTVYEAPHLKKIHPDILFEFPKNLDEFVKDLIIHLRYKYPGSGIYIKKMNSISLGYYNDESYCCAPFMEPIFTLQQTLYYDLDERKCYLAFETLNVFVNDWLYFAQVIKMITKNDVYLNTNNKQHPRFEKMLGRFEHLNLFKDYNPLELKYYGRRNYYHNLVEANVTVLVSYLGRYLGNINPPPNH